MPTMIMLSLRGSEATEAIWRLPRSFQSLATTFVGTVSTVQVFLGPLAQQVEQLPLKQEVGGSIPPWPTCRGGEIGKHARLRT